MPGSRPVPGADHPGGWPALTYRRLHGSPRIYYSDYGAERIGGLADTMVDTGPDPAGRSWCIFDDTALGSAIRNGLDLAELLRSNHR